VRKTLGQIFGCDSQTDLVSCIKKYNNIPYEVAYKDKNKGGKSMRKIIVSTVDQSDEYSGVFCISDMEEHFHYERCKDDRKLTKVSRSIGIDRDSKEDIFVELSLSEEELIFIDEQLTVLEIGNILPHLKIENIIKQDKKHYPIYAAITFKCSGYDTEITSHSFTKTKENVFTVCYFSTIDNENRTLELEIEKETKKKLENELLDLLIEEAAKEKVNI